MTKNNSFMEIELISEGGVENRLDNDWQTDCKDLNQRLSKKIRDYDANIEAQARDQKDIEEGAARSAGMFDFTSLLLSLASTETLVSIGGALWETLSKWQDNRKSCSCIIRVDDSEYHLNNLSKDELIEIMTKQSQKF